jgi:hypothetical protein
MQLNQSERNELVFTIADEIAADPPDMTRAFLIPQNSLLGMAFTDLQITAYVPEGQFRFVKLNEQRFLATCSICNCIAVFVTSPGHTAFCAHINPASFGFGLDELRIRRQVGGGAVVSIFKTMSDALKQAFKNVKTSEISVSLVGGWKFGDHDKRLDMAKYYKNDKTLQTFSSIVLKWVKDTLPGANVDTSFLNYFNGVSWKDRTSRSKLKKIGQGESFNIAAMDTHTGQIHVQTSHWKQFSVPHAEGYDGFEIPCEITEFAYTHQVGEKKRMHDHNTSVFNKQIPKPVLHEYVHIGMDDFIQWPDML